MAINSGYGTSLRHIFPNARQPFGVPSPRWKVPACRVNAVSSTRLARISAPTLLIAGEDDPVAPPSVARSIADRIKGARLHVLPRIAHWTTFEAANDVNALMKDFLAVQR